MLLWCNDTVDACEQLRYGMLTLYQISCADTKTFRTRLLVTHTVGDFGMNFCSGANLFRSDLE